MRLIGTLLKGGGAVRWHSSKWRRRANKKATNVRSLPFVRRGRIFYPRHAVENAGRGTETGGWRGNGRWGGNLSIPGQKTGNRACRRESTAPHMRDSL